jgi:hypothetical protein
VAATHVAGKSFSVVRAARRGEVVRYFVRHADEAACAS